MTELATALDCFEKVQEAAQNVRALLDLLPEVAQEVVDTEDVHDRAFSRALVVHAEERTDICKAKAQIDTEVERLAFNKARATEKRIKEALHSERSILSALQTVATGFREEAKLARWGPQ